jgi:5-methylthioadenosine/S-adenosylhomocysteine deaminase
MTNLVLRNCVVLVNEGVTYELHSGQDIWVKDQRIESILPSGEREPGPGDTIVSAEGMMAIPGLINTHAHIPMVLFRELVNDVPVEVWFNDYIWKVEANLTPEDVYLGALLGHAEMIENGITSVADRYFYMDQVAEATIESGMRANLVWTIFEHNGAQKIDQSSEFIQKYQGGGEGRLTTWMGPHSPYTVGPTYLKLVSERAKKLKVGIHIHVSETSRQVEQSLEKHGVTPVEMLYNTGVLDVPAILGHCKFPTTNDIQILSKVNAGVAHAPKTYMKHGSPIVDLSTFRAAGIPVGLATDGAASNSTLDILEQMRLMAMAQKMRAQDASVMPINEVLDIAFRGGAKVLQMETEIGELAPGKLADIVLIRLDGIHFFPNYNHLANLIYTARGSDVDTVIINGKIVMEDRQLKTIDKQYLMKQLTPRIQYLAMRNVNQSVAKYPD